MDKLLIVKLTGLECAHCSSTIEAKVAQMDNVETASLNFLTKELKIIFKNNFDKLAELEKISHLINSIEPSVKIVNEQNNDVVPKNNFYIDFKKLTRIIIGGLLLLISFKLPYFSIYFVAYFILGYDVLLKALKNLVNGKLFDENFLMTIATIGAFIIKEFPEAVAVMLFYQIGEFFQKLAVDRSRNSIKSLLDIKSDYAVLENGQKISPQDVNIGDIIIVKAGEKIPVDGVVVEGETFLDMKALIGEAVPRRVTVSDNVFSGSINTNSVLKIKVTKKYSDSTVYKILDLVENSLNKKSKSENFISKFAKVYTPIVVYTALILAFVVPIFDNYNFATWIERSLVFLVSSCPCALVVSIPLSFFSGIGTASKNGTLIKGSVYMQTLSQVDAVVFDKTGTLTKGVFNINEINTNNFDENEFLKLIYSMEKLSNHPISKAIVSHYENKFLEKEFFEIKNFEEISGYGLIGECFGEKILVGNYKLLHKNGIEVEKNNSFGSVIYVAKNNEYIGNIVICDEIKKDVPNIIKKLKKYGVKSTFILSGDKKENVDFISKNAGIDNYFAELLPQDKVSKFQEILNSGHYNKVAFVGDGINDAPVLAISDVGFAMGAIGCDAAIQAADIIIMDDDLQKILQTILISKKTLKIVKMNIAISLLIKFLVLFLAIFGVVSIWLAVFADVGVSVIAILNSMRKKL